MYWFLHGEGQSNKNEKILTFGGWYLVARLNLSVKKSQISDKFSKIQVYFWWVQQDLNDLQTQN
jgi:hypothetical protein